MQASKLNSQLAFEARKEPQQDIHKLEEEIAKGDKRVEKLHKVCSSSPSFSVPVKCGESCKHPSSGACSTATN